MKILERQIQKVAPGAWAKKLAIEKRFDEMEARLGFPHTRRYRGFVGPLDAMTRINEREWSSLAAMEAVMTKAMADPDYRDLLTHREGVILSDVYEIYTVEGSLWSTKEE